MRNVVLSTHINEVPGIAYKWRDFLRCEVDNLLVIEHPLHEWLINHPLHEVKGRVTLFVNNEQVFEKQFPKIRMPSMIPQVRDIALSTYYSAELSTSLKLQWDTFIGIDPLNAFSGIVLRKMGIVKKTIFYPVDFGTHRFDNPIKNMMYQELVQYVARNSDLVWAVSNRIAHYMSNSLVTNRKIMVVPHGYNKPPEKPQIDFSLDPTQKKLVYVGGLGPEVGLPLVLEALPRIVKKVPETIFLVIGHGSKEDIETLKALSRKYEIERNVQYLGVLPNEKVLDFLLQCDVGIATFSPVPSWTQFADMSMNVREYLACGLPVITTRFLGQGAVIEKNHAGVTIDYKVDEMVKAAIRLFTEKDFYQSCKVNTKPIVAEYTWNNIMRDAWKKTCKFFQEC